MLVGVKEFGYESVPSHTLSGEYPQLTALMSLSIVSVALIEILSLCTGHRATSSIKFTIGAVARTKGVIQRLKALNSAMIFSFVCFFIRILARAKVYCYFFTFLFYHI